MHKLKSTAVVLLGLVLTGCNSSNIRTAEENKLLQTQIKPTLSTVSKSDVLKEGGEITLPQNYSTKNYKKLVVEVSFYPQNENDADKFASDKSETLSSIFETKMADLKRFTIVSRSQLGQQALRDRKRFEDTGLVQSSDTSRLGKMKGSDYVLTGGIVLTSETFERIKNQEIIFTVTVNYQLIDAVTGEIIEADTAEGRSKRTYFATPNGTWIGGFNINDPSDAKNALNEAANGALIVIANKLGNKLPVGGQVVGIKGDLIQIDSGYDKGLRGKQIVALYAWDGVDIPLAYAEISPAADKSSGKIIQWSNAPEAQEIISRLKNEGMSYLREVSENGEYGAVMAVSKGMPIPPDWDNNYAN